MSDEQDFGIIGAAMNEGLDGETTLNASGHTALKKLRAEVERLRAAIKEHIAWHGPIGHGSLRRALEESSDE